MVNMKAALLTTVLGFLSVGTALSNAVDLNPSHGDIVDAVAHADPEARSFGGPEPLLSNAQRFARGLPPAKPASVQRGQ